MNFIKKSLMLVLLAGLSVTVAHKANAQAKPAWTKACVDPKKVETCRISQQLFMQKKDKTGKMKPVGRILGLTVLYVQNGKTKKREPHLSIQMPLGVDLRPGAVLKVDKGLDIPVKYLQCTQKGCDASIKLDAGFLKTLRAGNKLFVGFRPWGSPKTTVVGASLKGFTAKLNALK